MTGSNRAVPSKPSLDGLEDKHSAAWQRDQLYAFDRAEALRRPRGEIFSIDTPPPTASGALHIGHIYSYTQTDLIARYQRMRGRVVFYPIGWDDNGLPTERRVQNYFHVRCDPARTDDGADRSWEPATRRRRQQPPEPVSRRTFLALCDQLAKLDEQAFEAMWRRLGLSVDWSRTYTTIGPAAIHVSQRAFVRGLACRRGLPGRGTDRVGRRLPDRGGPGRAAGSGRRLGVPRSDLHGLHRRRPGRGHHSAGVAGGVRGAGRPSRR